MKRLSDLLDETRMRRLTAEARAPQRPAFQPQARRLQQHQNVAGIRQTKLSLCIMIGQTAQLLIRDSNSSILFK
jgi:hypothetical protein